MALVLAVGCGGKKGDTTAPSEGGGAETSSSKPAEANEDLADLRALDRQGSYEELLAKAGEVRPAKRDAEWESLLEKAAIAYLEQIAGKEYELAPVEVSNRLLEMYPVLGKRGGFMKARAEQGIEAYRRCYGSNCRQYIGSRNDAWSEAVYEFAETDPANIAFLAGKMMSQFLIPRVSAPVFALAAEHNGKQICADKDVKASVQESIVDGYNESYVAKINEVCGQIASR